MKDQHCQQGKSELLSLAMGMFLQVRWCRGQVLADKPHQQAHDLFFTIKHGKGDTWEIADLDVEIDVFNPDSRFEQIQAGLFDHSAVAVIECLDVGHQYVCRVWMMTGLVQVFACDKRACVKAYKATSIEDAISAGDQSTITIDKSPVTPSCWDRLFTQRLLTQ